MTAAAKINRLSCIARLEGTLRLSRYIISVIQASITFKSLISNCLYFPFQARAPPLVF